MAGMGDVRELLRLRDVRDGVVDTGEVLLRLLRVDGVRYDLLSPEERRRVDAGLFGLVTGTNFPWKVWATNRPVWTRRESERMNTLAQTWHESGQDGLAVLCRGMGEVLEDWQDRELPERLLFVSVWVSRGGQREAALAELDRRVDHLRRSLADALPGSEVQVLSTAGVLRAIHGYWQKDRHVRVRAEELGERGETVLMVSRREGVEAGAVAETQD